MSQLSITRTPGIATGEREGSFGTVWEVLDHGHIALGHRTVSAPCGR